MKHFLLTVILSFSLMLSGMCQVNVNPESGLLFHGIIMDANASIPLVGAQIFINRSLIDVSDPEGTFSFLVHKNDSVIFKHLGYKPTSWLVSDTLKGREFAAGIYLHTDTVSIGEVIIVPRYNNLRSQILNSPSKVPATMANARYNVAVSAYQGRTTQGKLGDPASNYNYIHRKQSIAAYEKGGIPSDQIAGISPLLLLPAAYMLLHGMPEKPPSFEKQLTDQEIDQIKQAYLEMQKK
jgi:hypothetical protein